MECFELRPGDFMLNAGIVGFLRMMTHHAITVGKNFDTTDRFLTDDLISMDLTQMYMDAFINAYGKETAPYKAIERLERLLEKMEREEEFPEKEIKEELKYIVEKLTAASLKSGFASIKDRVENGEIYEELCGKKIKADMEKQTLMSKLRSLQQFLMQPLVKETFVFKGIVYSVINKFWEGKCFLLRANAQKDMKELFRKEFEEPFKAYLLQEEKKPRFYCIECGNAISSKTATSIAFLKDMADDLSRKPSAFWNCTPDAYACPVCAFLYALAPLGFLKAGNDFVFINNNGNIPLLMAANTPKVISEEETTYQHYLNQAIQTVLEKNRTQISNVQVITRMTAEQKYKFFVIDKDILDILGIPEVKNQLEKLCEKSVYKMQNGDYFNVYYECISNLMNYREQYPLIDLLISESMRQSWITGLAYRVLKIQSEQIKDKGGEKMKNLSEKEFYASKEGYAFRDILLRDKVGNINNLETEKKEEILRGTVYQFSNALKVRNVGQFMDLVLRLYTSCKKPIPTIFMDALQDKEILPLIGYAFVFGLKGAYYAKETEEVK